MSGQVGSIAMVIITTNYWSNTRLWAEGERGLVTVAYITTYLRNASPHISAHIFRTTCPPISDVPAIRAKYTTTIMSTIIYTHV